MGLQGAGGVNNFSMGICDGAPSTMHSSKFLRCSRGANSKMCDGILQKFKLIQALTVVLIVCKNEEDPF